MSDTQTDIPQDVLMRAAGVVIMLPAFESIEATGDAVERIARAIMAAAKAEREACAKLAEEFAGQFPEYPEFDDQHNCAVYIASVIRGTADVNTAHNKNKLEA